MRKIIGKYKNHALQLNLYQRTALWALLFLAVWGVWAAGPPIAIEPIVLKQEPIPVKPKEFFIASVTDERANKNAVAYLFPAISGAAQAKAVTVDLKGGGRAAIEHYLKNNLETVKNTRPVALRLKELSITETAPASGRVEGRVLVHVAFDLLRDGEAVPLMEHKGGIRYIRPANSLEVVEPSLRKALTEALRSFDAWMNKEANQHVLLARSLKVNFADHTLNREGDTVFYSLDRPLTWADFKAGPSSKEKYAAAVFPGFAYEGENEVKNGVLHLNLKMKVFVVKSASWAREAARDSYTLNHEQRHFDIVKLVAERYKQKLHPDSLTLADYNSIMQYKYIESYREMNRLQEQYDSETKHGLDAAAQQRWNQKIDTELRALKVK